MCGAHVLMGPSPSSRPDLRRSCVLGARATFGGAPDDFSQLPPGRAERGVTMHERLLTTAVAVLVSFNLIACAEAEPSEAGTDSAITASAEDARFVETRQPAPYADAFPASPAEMKIRAAFAEGSGVASISRAQKTGVANDPPVAGDAKNELAGVDLAVGPSLGGTFAITDEQKDGVTIAPSIANDDRALAAAIVEECRARYVCTNGGELVLHREGTSCLLGDVILSSDWRAHYRETGIFPGPGSWRAGAEYIDVSFHDALTHCDRKE